MALLNNSEFDAYSFLKNNFLHFDLSNETPVEVNEEKTRYENIYLDKKEFEELDNVYILFFKSGDININLKVHIRQGLNIAPLINFINVIHEAGIVDELGNKTFEKSELQEFSELRWQGRFFRNTSPEINMGMDGFYITVSILGIKQ